MKKYLLILSLFFCLNIHGDLLRYENEYIKYSVPYEFLRQPSADKNFKRYTPDNQEKPQLIVQLFRHRKWAQWHMKGLYKSKDTFQKYFDKALGGPDGNTLQDITYNDKKFILALTWQRPDKSLFLSRLQLTSFGCVAFHIECDADKKKEAETVIETRLASLQIPDSLQFIPEDVASELLDNMGNAIYFVILSLAYLAFSLRVRGKMRKRKRDRRY